MITFLFICNKFLLQRKHYKPNHGHLFIPVNESLPVDTGYHGTAYGGFMNL
jgi:hypothetical protein